MLSSVGQHPGWPMAEYESLIHLPRWRRTIIWLCESHVLSWAIFLALLAPLFLFGWWWAVAIAGLCVGFYLGYWTARAYLLDGDDIPPL